MRLVLQEFKTGKYLAANQKWTTDVHQALEFADRERAIQLAHELKLQNVHLLMVSPDGRPVLGVLLSSGSDGGRGDEPSPERTSQEHG